MDRSGRFLLLATLLMLGVLVAQPYVQNRLLLGDDPALSRAAWEPR